MAHCIVAADNLLKAVKQPTLIHGYSMDIALVKHFELVGAAIQDYVKTRAKFEEAKKETAPKEKPNGKA